MLLRKLLAFVGIFYFAFNNLNGHILKLDVNVLLLSCLFFMFIFYRLLVAISH